MNTASIALLGAIASTIVLGATVRQTGVSCEGEPQALAHEVEPIPLHPGGVRSGEERSFSRLPESQPESRSKRSRARDLMFRDEDRRDFQATQPFLLPPNEIRSTDKYQRFLQQLRRGARLSPDDQRRFGQKLHEEAFLSRSRYQLVRRSHDKF